MEGGDSPYFCRYWKLLAKLALVARCKNNASVTFFVKTCLFLSQFKGERAIFVIIGSRDMVCERLRMPGMTEEGCVMSVSQKEKLMSLLFREGIKPLNVKFFRFGCAPVTEEQLCEQINSAFSQKEAGLAIVTDTFPETKRKIDVRARLAAL